MQLQSFKRYSPENHAAHIARVKAKHERIGVLTALLDMRLSGDHYDRREIAGLRKRLRSCQNELKNMIGE